jgi:hypothetical protein
MNDYGNMVHQLMSLAIPVADKMNPLAKGLHPLNLSEGAGAMGTGGGGRQRRIPISDIAHGESAMPGGKLTWPGARDLIREYANRPTPLPPIRVYKVDRSDPDAVRFWGEARWIVEDGSHRLEAAKLRGDKFIAVED